MCNIYLTPAENSILYELVLKELDRIDKMPEPKDGWLVFKREMLISIRHKLVRKD